ncbi:endospore coat-associated protein [Paenibacillus elgii]|uniref:Endospore coat-associated protein n=1 Tax=Paenibacillus elgii TaxID=189691 RepID=A0A2T6FT56_9BACL|nr:YheC/YheD family protein [Paenibacillus elgii]PUA35088.1 endospore coat-associated protein [Paenibacillus elgii]
MVTNAKVPSKREKPTLAILTHSDETRIFRGNQENFIDLIRAGAERGVLVYVMTTADFKLSGNKAVGYTYNEADKTWKRGVLPAPHVIYNRIPYRKFELLPEVQQVIQTCMRQRRIRFFNPSFFNKWTLFEWLNHTKKTKSYIPATRRLSSGEELDKLLAEYPFLYLKPIRGKAGKGIMKVSRSLLDTKSKIFELSIQEKTKSHISRYPSVSRLWSEVQELVEGKDYIIQQGIPLSSYKQRPFDLRVLVQKNGKGQWSVAGVGARLAGKLSITTHVPRGGSIDDPAKLLAYSFGGLGSKRIIARAKKAALTIAKQIEKSSGHMLGEMSMDLGVDQEGHIWFFEANSKPMKFDEPPIRKKSLENLILYSIYLAKRKPKRPLKKPETFPLLAQTNAEHDN